MKDIKTHQIYTREEEIEVGNYEATIRKLKKVMRKYQFNLFDEIVSFDGMHIRELLCRIGYIKEEIKKVDGASEIYYSLTEKYRFQ